MYIMYIINPFIKFPNVTKKIGNITNDFVKTIYPISKYLFRLIDIVVYITHSMLIYHHNMHEVSNML